MFRLASLIFRNVLRNKRRTFLTLASTTISLAILSMMMALYQGFFNAEDTSEAGALRLITRHRVALVQPLPSSYLQRVKQVPGVLYVTPYSWFQGKFRENGAAEQFARMAVNAEDVFDIYPDYGVPADQLEAFKKGRTACAVAKRIADQLHIGIGDRLTIVGDIYPVTLELTVAAIFTHPKNTEQVFFHQEYLSELMPREEANRDLVGTYLMRVDKPENVTRVAKAIDAMFDNSPYPTRTESEKQFAASFLAFLGNLKLYLGMICGAVTFTILLVTANAISMSVRERTRETAIMRTLGYAPGEILQLIVGESVLLSLMGCFLGMGIAWILLKGTATIPGFPILDLRWQTALIILAISMFVGVLAAAVPALVTARLKIVDSLRYAG